MISNGIHQGWDGKAVLITDQHQAIVNAMPIVKPGAINGALVSLTEIRKLVEAEFARPAKETFDKAVLDLAMTGIFALHRHDFPSSLTETERAMLVRDEHNNYYIGIAKRM